MRHSVIIPHRNRNQRLDICVWSLELSARLCGIDDWEAVIIDSCSRDALHARTLGAHARVVSDTVAGGPFCKSRCLNIGIEESSGDVLTFLDADAVVGKRFMEADQPLFHGCQRVCYRVRYLPENLLQSMTTRDSRRDVVGSYFLTWKKFGLGYEAYGRYDCDYPPATIHDQPWGNSQFSILRETLGETRYDEGYVGRGYEDLDMNMRLAAKFGADYRGFIWTDAEHAMFHVEHSEKSPDWHTQAMLVESSTRYRRKKQELGAALCLT